MSNNHKVVKVARTINFECGCMATYHLIGDLAGQNWQLINCTKHGGVGRQQMLDLARKAWWDACLSMEELTMDRTE